MLLVYTLSGLVQTIPLGRLTSSFDVGLFGPSVIRSVELEDLLLDELDLEDELELLLLDEELELLLELEELLDDELELLLLEELEELMDDELLDKDELELLLEDKLLLDDELLGSPSVPHSPLTPYD